MAFTKQALKARAKQRKGAGRADQDRAEVAGYLDGESGVPIERNPFDAEKQFALAVAWNKGWYDAWCDERFNVYEAANKRWPLPISG